MGIRAGFFSLPRQSEGIGLFKGARDLMVVLRVNLDGSLMWNIMQAKSLDMNKHRVGVLLYGK